MVETTKVIVTLADGTKFEAVPDGVGNLTVPAGIEKDVLSRANLSEVQYTDENGVSETAVNQMLRTYYTQADGSAFIRFGDMTAVEMLEATYDAKIEYLAMMTDVDLDEEV